MINNYRNTCLALETKILPSVIRNKISSLDILKYFTNLIGKNISYTSNITLTLIIVECSVNLLLPSTSTT